MKFERLKTTVTTMDFFNRFVEAGVVSDDGYIRKCFDNVIDGVTVSDMLRDALLNEDSEHADVFSAEERTELIYELFRMVVTGGSMCQYEDYWTPYLDVVKVRLCLFACLR